MDKKELRYTKDLNTLIIEEQEYRFAKYVEEYQKDIKELEAQREKEKKLWVTYEL